MKFYTFKTSDGQIEVLTLEQAHKHPDPLVQARFHQVILSNRNVKRKKDGFEPGWQENIGMYCGDRRQYNDALKAKGLIEIGNDYTPTESVGDYSFTRSEEFVKACIDEGVELSGNEQEAIKTGEFFKGDPLT